MAVKRRKCAKCQRNRDEKFYTSSRGRICQSCRRRRRSHKSKDVRLQETYGIDMDDYQAMWDAQDGKCAICLGVRRVLEVDHDHQLQKRMLERGEPELWAARSSVRGLACRRCNGRLLPSCLDDVAILERAIAYLKVPPARMILHG